MLVAGGGSGFLGSCGPPWQSSRTFATPSPPQGALQTHPSSGLLSQWGSLLLAMLVPRARVAPAGRQSATCTWKYVCCVGPGVKGLSLCWYVKVTCLHSRAPQAHLLVACWCSQRGLHRTICHPAAVMITSVLPCRPLSLLWSHHSLLPPVSGCVDVCVCT